MYNVVSIIIGGALGALTRYQVGVWVSEKLSQSFPWPTYIVNITGAFLLGFLNVMLLERLNVNPAWQMGIGVGFLGAYTTFSTFSYEIIKLIEEGCYFSAGLYAVSSVLLGLIFAALGIGLARQF